MSEKIEPALSQGEWAEVFLNESGDPSLTPSPGLVYEKAYLWGTARPHASIAILNAALLPDDPRKITRAKLRRLRDQVAKDDSAFDNNNRECNEFLDALESYLAPEGGSSIIDAAFPGGSVTTPPPFAKRILGMRAYVGGARLKCPACKAEIDTENRLREEQMPNGIRFMSVPCTNCRASFTVELTATTLTIEAE